MTQPPLMNRYYLISYHRRGFTGSKQQQINSNNHIISISQQATDCQKLMDYLNIKSVHIVGHSHGGVE